MKTQSTLYLSSATLFQLGCDNGRTFARARMWNHDTLAGDCMGMRALGVDHDDTRGTVFVRGARG